ncbi:glycoside hydrolase family 2 protein [Marinilabiliaceae bacterium JC017]|nr:glycoside hydrolase family 2 protein [Marinilabiliaceae bacterium JC017]
MKKTINWLLVSVIGLMGWSCTKNKSDHQTNVVQVDLSQSDWMMRRSDSDTTYKAQVPGSVHMDLLRNKVIEDPYYRDNETRLQWIGEKDWVYTTQFDVAAEVLNRNNVELDFKGLDTYAKVYLNDSLILDANNFFREYKIDCKSLLKANGNTMRVEFTSPVTMNKKLREEARLPLRDDYVYTRKPSYHFGWDWGPIYITAGIWRPVYINAWNTARFDNMQAVQKHLTDEEAVVELKYEIEADAETTVVLVADCGDGIKLQETVQLKPGMNYHTSELKIEKPERWWPAGLGEQKLYNIHSEILIGGDAIDVATDRIGLRTLELVQKLDLLGKSFHFEVNGSPVFAKGANYIPQDMFLNRPTRDDYEYIIQQAVEANMNMLRVWGGGFYENDLFYDLCDEKGLMVWQDFMFACAMYPGDEEFLNNVKEEAISNVKRIRNHPCIALWCGNNENYIGWKDWQWSSGYSKEDSASLWHDYEALYHKLLPEVIEKYDADRQYWPSSPKHGWGYPVNADGDVHYWGIWHAQEPFEEFAKPTNIGRFMSEYGFQSCPEFKTVKEFTIPEDWDIYSDVMKNHQKHRVGYPVIDKYIKWYYKWPKDFQSYLYVSQVLQAKGIGYAIEIHRRNMPHCMGTLYWQINDCWPVASWASIDSYRRWKALHYTAKKVYNDVLVSPFVENGQLRVYVVSDRLKQFDATIDLKLLSLDGAELWSIKLNKTIAPNASEVYFEVAEDELLKGIDKKDVVLVASVDNAGKTESVNHFYFVQPKDLKLTKPAIDIQVNQASEGYEIVLSTDHLAKNVFLWLDEADGFFTDNYFDLVPGTEKRIKYLPKDGEGSLEGKIKYMSLIDSF